MQDEKNAHVKVIIFNIMIYVIACLEITYFYKLSKVRLMHTGLKYFRFIINERIVKHDVYVQGKAVRLKFCSLL